MSKCPNGPSVKFLVSAGNILIWLLLPGHKVYYSDFRNFLVIMMIMQCSELCIHILHGAWIWYSYSLSLCLFLHVELFLEAILLISLLPPLHFSAHNGGIEANWKSFKSFPSTFDVFNKFWKRCTLETFEGDVVTGNWFVSFM